MATFASGATLPIQDGVGTVGYTVKNKAGTVNLINRTTAGVTRIFEGDGYGIYQAMVTLDDDDEPGSILWDDADGNAKAFFFGAFVSGIGVGAYVTPSELFIAQD